jgi:hypothetical protein
MYVDSLRAKDKTTLSKIYFAVIATNNYACAEFHETSTSFANFRNFRLQKMARNMSWEGKIFFNSQVTNSVKIRLYVSEK